MEKRADRNFFLVILVWIVIIAAFGILVESTFLLNIAGYTSALALMGLSVNVMLGGVGEVPLGQALFFGIGAYAIGICMKNYGLSYELAILVGMATAAVVALVIGIFTLRLTGAYFSIVSWGITGVAVVAALNLEHITGGGMGIFGIPRMTLFGLDLSSPRHYFYGCAAPLVAVVILLHAVRRSRFGRAIESVRQNPHLARSIGVDVFRQRLKSFVLSAAIAALAGALTLPYTQIVTHESLSVYVTVDGLLMALLGGTQWLFGPVVGAMIFSILPFYIEMDVNIRVLVFSLAIILIMMFVPGGLYQMGQSLLSRVKGSRNDAK